MPSIYLYSQAIIIAMHGHSPLISVEYVLNLCITNCNFHHNNFKILNKAKESIFAIKFMSALHMLCTFTSSLMCKRDNCINLNNVNLTHII